MSGDPRIKCSCDMVGWCGDLAKVASPRSLPELCLGRVDGASIFRGRLSLPEVGLGRGGIVSLERSLGLNRAHQAFVALC
jgi:hypothetical protein